ncbi:hypothetical protein [Streptomyces sp. NPDC014793]|uniref:hypothetical protein n=1 Tax=Streptomyces sp. NPDC014793 TaxID=3364914 RepID=UPI0036F790FA
MLVQSLAAAGVLAVLTVVPGPDMAVVTRRAVACGRRDGLRTVGGITAGLLTWGVLTLARLGGYVLLLARARAFFEKPAVRRVMDRVTGVVLIGFGIKVAVTQP